NNVLLSLDPSSGPVTCKTTWTLLLYLTSSAEGCVGGETVFFPNDRRSAKEEIPVALETGMLLLHKHGDDCMLVSLGLSFFSRTRRPGDFFVFSPDHKSRPWHNYTLTTATVATAAHPKLAYPQCTHPHCFWWREE
ncbi:hypothetical protein CCHL11_00575, partial [Colletotrichum chlorophyti]